MSDPSKLGFGGGVRLVDYAEDPSEWDDKTEGFSIAVMHQLHCVVSISCHFFRTLINNIYIGRAETFVNTVSQRWCNRDR